MRLGTKLRRDRHTLRSSTEADEHETAELHLQPVGITMQLQASTIRCKHRQWWTSSNSNSNKFTKDNLLLLHLSSRREKYTTTPKATQTKMVTEQKIEAT